MYKPNLASNNIDVDMIKLNQQYNSVWLFKYRLTLEHMQEVI